MVERGPGPGTLDSALLEQARALGVEVRFGSRLERLEPPGVLATGPKAADAIAVGYHFDTDMPDGFWAICDDALAPQGYAYLLVMRGRGTVKSCMFSGFKSERLHVERTVEAFRRLVGLQMRDARPHGGVGNFRVPASVLAGGRPVAGEEAGFQDALWGFGMRLAIRSGVLAARALIEGADYDALWRLEIAPWQRTSIVNRSLYGLLGNPATHGSCAARRRWTRANFSGVTIARAGSSACSSRGRKCAIAAGAATRAAITWPASASGAAAAATWQQAE